MTTENTPQTASEKAEVMLAFDRGETIEAHRVGSEIWGCDYSPSWDWQYFEWRVMAKQIESWIWVYPNGVVDDTNYGSKDSAERARHYSNGRAVLMREVVE